FDGVLWLLLPQLLDDSLQGLAGQQRRLRWKNLRQADDALLRRIGLDLTLIHQAPRRDECHFPLATGHRTVLRSARTSLARRTAGPADRHKQHLRDGGAFELEIDTTGFMKMHEEPRNFRE